MDKFPILFSCSTQCDATIENVLLSLNSKGVRDWNVSFVRGFNDWKVVVVVEFFDFLASIVVPKEGPDGLRWKLCKDGVFDSRSFYLALNARMGVRFLWRSIWAVKAPPRVAFFIWTAAWGRILTCDNLMRHDYTMVERCCMCCFDRETVDHLLLLARVLWNFVFKAFGIHWVISQHVVDLLFGWRNWFGKHHSCIWNIIPLCLMWLVWRERNARMFEDMSRSEAQLLETFANSLYDWSWIWGLTTTNTVFEFVVSLDSVSSPLQLVMRPCK